MHTTEDIPYTHDFKSKIYVKNLDVKSYRSGDNQMPILLDYFHVDWIKVKYSICSDAHQGKHIVGNYSSQSNPGILLDCFPACLPQFHSFYDPDGFAYPQGDVTDSTLDKILSIRPKKSMLYDQFYRYGMTTFIRDPRFNEGRFMDGSTTVQATASISRQGTLNGGTANPVFRDFVLIVQRPAGGFSDFTIRREIMFKYTTWGR